MRFSGWMLIGCTVLGATSSQAAVTFTRASGGIDAQLFTFEKGQQVAKGSGFSVKTLPADPLTGEATLTATGAVTGTLSGAFSVQFSDPSQFTVSFASNSIDLATTDLAHSFDGYVSASTTYYFSVDTETSIQFDYSSQSSGVFASTGFAPKLAYGLAREVPLGQPLQFIDTGQLSGSGTLTTKTVGPGNYYVFLQDHTRLTAPAGTAAKSTSLSGTVAVSLLQSAVPEPASWMMMIAGFGLLGTTLRRQRVAGYGSENSAKARL